MQAAGVNTASRGKSIQKRKANESVNCQCKLQVEGRIEGATLKRFSTISSKFFGVLRSEEGSY